ncbi:hypothetical protein EST38_g2421 [Candolleomyces aberdarensis]|uniref:Carboxylesterase type B domain-containing protein n=1 Tax=Candolleomyces aberdarensis TaxID=2316362 RepID=A0A4Q2DUP6_9AGAR|nr:hypothetical protein EST38_g2421 [Candolleomyces aberdarensis]
MPFEDKVGLGKPTENPLFLNIHIPPSYPSRTDFPVKVYIHGGFLQFGCPHSLGSQAQYVSAERNEIWVNIGYRLSAFGFLASDKHGLKGNYGFKDQWLALEWIKANIAAFGGAPEATQITGLSAGAHSVQQLLHHASQLPEGQSAPFTSAVLQSNAILADPKTPAELRPQFEALCKALKLDPDADDVLETLKDPTRVSSSDLTNTIEHLESYGTFRGCLSDDWIITSPGPMERQRNGTFSRALQARGVRFVVFGDLTEEWYLYSIAHPIERAEDVITNLERYFSSSLVRDLVGQYPALPPKAKKKDLKRRFGEILSVAQVHLPVRVLARDLVDNGFPVLRYEIRWTPEELRPFGYVTHGTDRALWALRLPVLTEDEQNVARRWLDVFEEESKKLLAGKGSRDKDDVLVLKEDRSIGWTKDREWEKYEKLAKTLLRDDLASSHKPLL